MTRPSYWASGVRVRWAGLSVPHCLPTSRNVGSVGATGGAVVVVVAIVVVIVVKGSSSALL